MQSNTSYYYLALRSNNTVELKRLVSGSSTTLASASITVSTGTWYTLSLSVNGSQLRGTVNGGTALTATDTRFTSGQVGVATFYSSANFDDVLVQDDAGPPVTSTPPVTDDHHDAAGHPDVTPTDPNPQPNVADGYAAMNAWGRNGTSGGAGGPTVTVTTASAFLSAIATAGPLNIRVSGMIALPGPMHNVTSNKTIVGVGSNSGFTGGGLNIGIPIDDNITSPPANAVNNIIIRNLNFNDWPDDAMNVQMFSHHIWIDHNTWGTGSDGGLDIKRGSSYVTVSWNHADGTNKNMLLGRDDADSAQDTGRLLVTYHHNWFDATTQRNPRVRFGNPVHVYNNYYNDTGNYGVAATIGSGVLVEANTFENVDDPYHLAEGDSSGGSLVARDNCLIGETEPGRDGRLGPVDPVLLHGAAVLRGQGRGHSGRRRRTHQRLASLDGCPVVEGPPGIHPEAGQPMVSRKSSMAWTIRPSTATESTSGPGTYIPWSASSTSNTYGVSSRAAAPSHASSAVPPMSRNGAVACSRAAVTHGRTSSGVSQTAGSERSATSDAAFEPSDLPRTRGTPPTESSSGAASARTQSSISSLPRSGGSGAHTWRCTVAPRRCATSPAYMSMPAEAPYRRPGSTTASATGRPYRGSRGPAATIIITR